MSTNSLIFGTYVQGLYTAAFDTVTGHLSIPHQAAKLAEPTYLAVTPHKIVYAIEQHGEKSGIASFRLTPDQKLHSLSKYLSWNAAPVHVNLIPGQSLVLVSNYRSGLAQIFRQSDTGRLTLTDTFQNVGQGVLPQQNTSHIHFMGLTPDSRLVILDLGTDQIFTFNIDLSSGRLLTRQAVFHCRPGFGPRHLVFHGNHAFVLGELASTVAVLVYDPTTGQFTQKQLISTIPDNWIGETGGGAIHQSTVTIFTYPTVDTIP